MKQQKLSKLLLGSALVLGLGASTGSFAALPAFINQATVAAAASQPGVSAAISGFMGTASFTADAAGAAALATALEAKSGSAEARELTAKIQAAAQKARPGFFGRIAAATSRFRIAVVTLLTSTGMTAAAANATAAAIQSNPVAAQVAGHGMIECVTEWKGQLPREAAAVVIADLATAKSVAEHRENSISALEKLYPGESREQRAERLEDSMASKDGACDIDRAFADPKEGAFQPRI